MKKIYEIIVNFGTNKCKAKCAKDKYDKVDCKKCKLSQKVLIEDKSILSICDILIQIRESLRQKL